MDIRIVTHNSPEYEAMVDLRTEVLRKPLGLQFTKEQLAAESADTLVGAFENGHLKGCCILTPNSPEILQLRQMAVATDQQGKGTGRFIIEFAENWGRENGYKTLTMHARDVAIGFYQKCGYRLVGEGFTEVGIPHHLMEKSL